MFFPQTPSGWPSSVYELLNQSALEKWEAEVTKVVGISQNGNANDSVPSVFLRDLSCKRRGQVASQFEAPIDPGGLPFPFRDSVPREITIPWRSRPLRRTLVGRLRFSWCHYALQEEIQ